MHWRCPVRVMVSMKAIARIASAWDRRKSAHLTVARCRGRIDTVGREDLPHSGGSDLDTEQDEFAVDAPVAPRGVLGRQTEDEATDRSESKSRSPRSTPRDSVTSNAARNILSSGRSRGRWSLQEGELVVQSEDLDVPLAVGHRQEPQRGEHVDNGEIDEANQHKTRSCRTATGHPPTVHDLHGCISRHVQGQPATALIVRWMSSGNRFDASERCPVSTWRSRSRSAS